MQFPSSGQFVRTSADAERTATFMHLYRPGLEILRIPF